MRKKYLLKYIIGILIIINLSNLNAIEIKRSNINPDSYIILLGTYVGINDARRFANSFQKEEIYILKDKNTFTVRIVNIQTKQIALKKLDYIKKRVPDALIWKKMTFLRNGKFNKLHSQIYTIDSIETAQSNFKTEG